jgi:hypothetical protein
VLAHLFHVAIGDLCIGYYVLIDRLCCKYNTANGTSRFTVQ